MKQLPFIALLILLCVSIWPGLAHATDSEHIQRFGIRVAVTRDNTATITETIVYDFLQNNRYGIFRDIPIDYKDGNDTYYLNFTLESVTRNGTSEQVETNTVDGTKRLKIGDSARTISGIHTYVVTYTLSPIVTNKQGVPFLNLDVVGEGWQVPISNVSVSISLEDSAQLSNVSWLGAINISDNPGQFSATKIPAGQGITINAELPPGYVSSYLEPNKQRLGDAIARTFLTIGFGIAIACGLAGIVVAIIRTVRTHKRRKKQIVVAQYEPPSGMSPAHIGLLKDDIAETKEITATIIDWAVRGYLKIVYIPKKGFFGAKDYQLVMLQNSSHLPRIEAPLFTSLFDGKPDILVSKLVRTNVASQATLFKSAIKAELTDKGYYDKDENILMHGTLTEKGAEQWALVDGFRLYLSVVEKDRLKFSDAPDKTPERFSALLPYAIALGVEKQWAQQFKGIDLVESTTWYSGNLAAFSAVSLVSSLGGSFASTVSSSSSNSSVSSSGGSSGGGFGGGGGGSW